MSKSKKVDPAIQAARDRRAGRVPGISRQRGMKPGRSVIDGVLCYDGSGLSGYTGPCSAPSEAQLDRSHGVRMKLIPRAEGAMLPSHNSRRARKNIWVPAR